jgi:hypothetical protein
MSWLIYTPIVIYLTNPRTAQRHNINTVNMQITF